jgi:hypothetical protein
MIMILVSIAKQRAISAETVIGMARETPSQTRIPIVLHYYKTKFCVMPDTSLQAIIYVTSNKMFLTLLVTIKVL